MVTQWPRSDRYLEKGVRCYQIKVSNDEIGVKYVERRRLASSFKSRNRSEATVVAWKERLKCAYVGCFRNKLKVTF